MSHSLPVVSPSLPWDPPGTNPAHDELPDTGTVELFWSNGFLQRYCYRRTEMPPAHVKHYRLTSMSEPGGVIADHEFNITRLYSNTGPWHDFVTSANYGYNRCVTLLFNGTLPGRMLIGTTIAWNVK